MHGWTNFKDAHTRVVIYGIYRYCFLIEQLEEGINDISLYKSLFRMKKNRQLNEIVKPVDLYKNKKDGIEMFPRVMILFRYEGHSELNRIGH